MTLVLLIIGIIATVVGIFACFFRGEFFEDWPKGVKVAFLVVGILLIFLSQSVYVVKTNHTGVSVTLGQVRSTTNKDNYWYVLHYSKIVQIKLFLFF